MLVVERVSPPLTTGGRSSGMHARVTTLEVPPDRMDDATRHVQEQVLPRLSQMEGFRGFVALGSRHSGKLQGVSFWESEEALRATEDAVVPIREGVAEAAGGSVVSVEEFEVSVFEAPSSGPVSGVTDTVGGTVSGATDTVRGVTDSLSGGGEKQR
jgi:heme-degrading monooxygenase HmoA